MTPHTLQLNADYGPMKVVRWERAIELILEEKAVTVEAYPGRFVRSVSLALPWPAVIALTRYARARERVRFSSRTVQARDMWTCAYCGVRPRRADGRPERKALTLDHVIPRAQAKEGRVYLPWSRRWVKVSCWENAVAACPACNTRKADRSPLQAGMALRFHPRVPTHADALRIALDRIHTLPPEWAAWLPEQWRADGAPSILPTAAGGAG